MKPRDRLLAVLAIVGEGPAAGAEAAARRLAADDWRPTDAILARHRVSAAFLHRAHARLLAGSLPELLLAACRQRAQVTLARNLRHLKERDRVLAALGAARVPVLVLKGACLLDRAYPSPGMRPMSDIDLLVHPGDAPQALAVLARSGYQSSNASAAELLAEGKVHEISLAAAEGPGSVDLHVAVKRPGAGYQPRLTEALWADARPFAPAATATVGEPSPAAHLMYLVCHATLQHSLNRLRQLLDLHYPLDWWQRDPGWNWPRTVDLARELDLERALDASLVTLDRLLGTDAARARGLSGPEQGTLWRQVAGPMAEFLLSDRSASLESLLPLSEYWYERRSWRAVGHLLGRGALVTSGHWEAAGRPTRRGPAPAQRPQLAARLVFRLQVLVSLLRDPVGAWRFLKLQGGLRRSSGRG